MLSTAQLEHLHLHRYVIVPNWLSVAQTAALQHDALAVDAHSGFESHVGTASPALDHSIRRSRQRPFYPPPSNAAGCVATREKLIAAVNKLRDTLQSSALMDLPSLRPFETELSYLCYPDGGHYQRHLDQPYANAGWVRRGRCAADGGSLSGYRTRRVVSFVLYLNRDWQRSNGGALRLFPAHERMPEHERGHSSAESELAGFTEDVAPEGGTLVVFMSGDVEHQVRVTRAQRQCIVGWFKESQSSRVLVADERGNC